MSARLGRAVRTWAAMVGLAAGLAVAGAGRAQQLVEVPSLDRAQGAAQRLSGHWFASPEPGRRPAVLMLHGCGGAVDAQGRLVPRWVEQAALFQAEGWHVLVLDSFTARGSRQICTVPVGSRSITQQQRRRDALGALQWLARQPSVDAARLALVGWSNGGSTVLAATNLAHPEVAAAPVRPRAAVAYYPGCETERQRGHAPATALMLQVGSDDDWTPAAPCSALVAEAIADPLPGSAAPRPLITVHAGAHHGFDGAGPVRLRSDVPNGARPGAGVHVGGQPEARQRARQEVQDFLRRWLQAGG